MKAHVSSVHDFFRAANSDFRFSVNQTPRELFVRVNILTAQTALVRHISCSEGDAGFRTHWLGMMARMDTERYL